MELQAYLKLVVRVLIIASVLLGAIFRYARTFPSVPAWFGSAPWVLLLLTAALAFLVFLAEMPAIGLADLAMFALMCLIALTYLTSTARYGVADQLPFAGNFLLPIPVFFAVRLDRKFTPELLETALVPFALAASGLSLIEFYTDNFGARIFNFGSYWNEVGNVGYHASAVHYALLGMRNRPWGVLALPESSGALMAALALYFCAGRKTPLRLTCMASCIAATYASGSRTAILTIAVFGLVMAWHSDLPRLIKYLSGSVALIAAVVEVATLTTFYDPQLQIHGFIYLTLQNFWNFISPVQPTAFVIHLFMGGGGISVANPMTTFTGEVALLNWVAYLGVLPWLVMALLFFFASRRYAGASRFLPTWARRIRPAYLLMLAVTFGSLHYDAVSRYPSNVIVAVILALLLRPVRDSFPNAAAPVFSAPLAQSNRQLVHP